MVFVALIVCGAIILILIGIFVFAASPREMDDEALQEVSHESLEELRQRTTHAPMTLKEREAQNEREIEESK